MFEGVSCHEEKTWNMPESSDALSFVTEPSSRALVDAVTVCSVSLELRDESDELDVEPIMVSLPVSPLAWITGSRSKIVGKEDKALGLGMCAALWYELIVDALECGVVVGGTRV